MLFWILTSCMQLDFFKKQKTINMKNTWIIYLLLIFTFSCKKDSDVTNITQTGPFPIVNVESSLTGVVESEFGFSVADADVNVAGINLKTNKDGLFFVPKKLMNKNGQWVKVSKAGYFDTGKFAFQNLGNSNFIKIRLMSKNLNQIISATTDQTVNIPGMGLPNGGGKIEFKANSFITESGQAYTSNVKVFFKFLDPSSSVTYENMPGDLRAEDKDGNARILKTFGMVGVEMEGNNGQKLKLASGSTAKISLTIPSSMLSNAPSTIPLWHFDQSTGMWIEEGSATLVDGKYVGEVSHFSFWNCDIPTNYMKLSGCVGNETGTALQGMKIVITSSNFGNGYAFSDSKGLFGGYVPANEQLTIKIFDQCETLLYNEQIGPYTSDTDLGKIKLTLNNIIKIKGKLLDCDNNPLETGFVLIKNDSISQTFTSINGEFEISFNNCSKQSKITLLAYDYSNPYKSNPIELQVTGSMLDAGNIIVCEALDEYISVNLNGSNFIFGNVGFQEDVGYFSLQGSANDSTYVNLIFKTPNQLIADMNILSCTIIDQNNKFKSIFCDFCSIGCGCNLSDKLVLTNFGGVGQYSSGTLNGTHIDNISGLQTPYVISFKAKLK